MELAFSSDQRELLDAFEQFFANESGPAIVRRAEPLGHDDSLWHKVDAMEVWGSGASTSDLAVIAESAGRWIAPVPFVEHAVASPLIDGLGAGIATISLRPADADGVWRLVPAGAVADVVIGVDGADLVAVRSTPPGSGPLNHASAPLADRSARDGERTVLGPAADMAMLLARWKVLTAASLVGVASMSLELALKYVQERQQFGVPIGSFQAVQHGLADLPGLIDGARLLAHKAAGAIDRGADGLCNIALNEIDDPLALASMAFVFAGDVAAHATDRSLHFHGGYGFAEEYDIQLYYRRARGWALILGEPAAELLTLADRFWPAAASAQGSGH
ncbi:MAG: acdA 15 [Ilumatobacteraceae bacterium]|nr:acdA 15 [Ilumatobacteraceae bacterium]MCU1389346.1 acdA 15 [Ilumatobacteraceae bacterium]